MNKCFILRKKKNFLTNYMLFLFLGWVELQVEVLPLKMRKKKKNFTNIFISKMKFNLLFSFLSSFICLIMKIFLEFLYPFTHFLILYCSPLLGIIALYIFEEMLKSSLLLTNTITKMLFLKNS